MIRSIGSVPRRACALLLVLLLSFGTLISGFITPAWAPILPVNRVYIQTSVDTSSWDIVSSVVSHSIGTGGNPKEAERVGETTLKMLVDSDMPSDSDIVNFLTTGDFKKQGGNTVKNLPLCFPGAISFSGWDNNSSQADTDRAQLVRNSISYDLNAAFKFAYGDEFGIYTPAGNTLDEQIKQYARDMGDFLAKIPGTPGTTVGNAKIVTTDPPKNPVDAAFNSDAGTEYYVTIERKIGGRSEVRTFQYRMLKGYGVDGSGLSSIPDDGTEYIHWGTLAVEAFANISAEDDLKVTASNVTEGTPGIIESAFAGLIGGIADFIANALGLWNFDELIFNSGLRGSRSYVGGVFPSSWQSVIWTFFFISEIVAIIMLLYAIIFNVGRKAMSTVDPVARASAIEQIKYLFIVAFLLAIIPFVIPLLIDVSAQLTGVFHDVLGDKTAQERFKKLASNSGGLGSILTYLVYLGALLYFNVFYVFRSLSIALMIILMPIFIAMMALSEVRRKQTLEFFKEFCANLFIQPLQALMLSFILLVPDSGRNIDSIVMAYVMIPLTNLLRQMFFGNAGGLADSVGAKGQRAGRGAMMFGGLLAAGAIKGAGKGIIGGIKGATGKAEGASEGGEAGGAEERKSGFISRATEKFQNSKAGQAISNATAKAGRTIASGANNVKNWVNDQPVVQGAKSVASSLAQTTAGRFLGRAGNTVGGAITKHVAPVAGGAAMVASGTALGALGGAVGVVDKRLFGGALSKPLTQLSKSAVGAGIGTMAAGIISKPKSAESGESKAPGDSPYKDILSNPGKAAEGDNAYAQGFATRSKGANGLNTYTVGHDNFKNAGVRAGAAGKDGSGRDQFSASYNMSKLSQADQVRLKEMQNTWENGSDEEKAAMRAMGITGFEAQTRMVNGQEEMTGAQVTYDSEKARDNLGIRYNSGKGNQSGPAGYSVTTMGDSAPALVPDMPSVLNTPKAAAALGTAKMESMGFNAQVDSNTGAVTFSAPAKAFQEQPVPEAIVSQFAGAKVDRHGNMSVTVPQADLAAAFGGVAASSGTMASRSIAADAGPNDFVMAPSTQSTMPQMVAPAIHNAQTSLTGQGFTVTPSADGQTYTVSGDANAFTNAHVPAGLASNFGAPQFAPDGTTASITIPASDLAQSYSAGGKIPVADRIPVATPAAHNCAEVINAQPGVHAQAQGGQVFIQTKDLESLQGLTVPAPIAQDIVATAMNDGNGTYTAVVTPQTLSAYQAGNNPQPEPQPLGAVLIPDNIPHGRVESVPVILADVPREATGQGQSFARGGEQLAEELRNHAGTDPSYDDPPRQNSDLDSKNFGAAHEQ